MAKAAEYRQTSLQELEGTLAELRRKVFDLRSEGKLEKIHQDYVLPYSLK